MSTNGAPAPNTAPSFDSFSFSFSRPSLLSRLNMAQVAAPEPSPSTGSTSAVTATSNNSGSTTSGTGLDSNTRSSSITQADQEMRSEEDDAMISQDTTPSPNGVERGLSTPRGRCPNAMEIDTNGDPEITETPSSHPSGASRIPVAYRDLPANHYFIAPPAALPYPRSPVQRFSQGHPLYTQPSLFGHLPRAPPRSPRLDPLEILELESARERNEWEQVCKDLGRTRIERPSTTVGPSQPQSQPQTNGNPKKTVSQAPPSEDDYDSDSSDVELRIYNADPAEETQTPIQPDSTLGTVPPTPLGARPPVAQSLNVPNGTGSAAHRSIIERLSQGPSTPRVPGTTPEAADRPAASTANNTTPAKRKIDDVDQSAQASSAKRISPAPQRSASERAGVPPPLRAELDLTPVPAPNSSAPPAPTTTGAAIRSQVQTRQPTAPSSSSTQAAPVAKSGNICRFHNRPPGRVCVRKDQCPDLHIGELQKTSGTSPAPSLASEPSTAAAPPPVVAPPMSRTPSLANAPPLGTNPSPPRPSRTPCRYFSRPTGCARGANCPFAHGSNEQTSRPPSRQLAPSPIPAISAPTPVHVPKSATSSILAPGTAGPSISAPTAAPFTTASAPSVFTPQPMHPLPAKPPPAVTSPTTSPKASTAPTKGKKGKTKATQQGPSGANKPSGATDTANVQVKIEPDAPTPSTRAAKRKASESQPKPQPTRVDAGTREIKQEEVTLYDLADDSPVEPSGSSVLPSELTQSQPRVEVPPAQGHVSPSTDAQPQPRAIAPLATRVVPLASTPASTVLPPLNRPPPPRYRPPPASNPSPMSLSQVSPAPLAPAALIVPVTAVIPPTPARPIPEQVSNASVSNTTSSPAVNTPKPPTNGTPIQTTNAPKPSSTPAPTATTNKLSIPVPPRSNPSPARPRPDMAPDSPPSQSRPDSRGLVRRMSPARKNSRDSPRRNSRDPDQRSLMTRIDGRSYRPSSRSRSPPPQRRHYSPPPPRRRSPPPPRGRSPSPVRYRDWRSRSRSPIRRPLRDRFVPRAKPSRRSPSPRYSRSPSRSPMYRSSRSQSPSRSRSRSFSRSPSRSPPRQRYTPRAPPADGYTNGSAYFPPENHIPRSWESQAGGSRPVQSDSSPSDTMVIVDEPTRNSTPPPRNAIAALNEYDSFNQSRTMDISPLSSPARGYGNGLGNRIRDYSPPATNDYPPSTTNAYAPPPPEPRENLLTRMTGEPDLANRLAPAGRAQLPNRPQPASHKPTKPQQPLANRLGGGGDAYPGLGSRNDRRPPPPRDTGVRGGKLMSRMTGQ
ncbi:Cell surface glycoprotein 1 [Rhizoctonia solani]|uniref:Cell surface glycoprotein 1 n=1 Tax=Rhizoctonia solani TaxID=456999 RepID=A0A0K6FZW9_9AGAM|nr:Cell surface glycoprotein 1 [Rhizoctonia solani]